MVAGRQIYASLYGRIAGAENPNPVSYGAVVTGASKGSIAASVVARCSTAEPPSSRDHLQARRGAAGVLPHGCVATTPVTARRGWSRRTWRPTPTSTPWVEWIGTEQTESWAVVKPIIKDAQTPLFLSSRHVVGDLSKPVRAEMEMKVLLYVALTGGPSTIGAERDTSAVRRRRLAQPWHVRRRRRLRRSQVRAGCRGEPLARRVVSGRHGRLAHALIGWTRGTGLMGHNDAIVAAVEEVSHHLLTDEYLPALLPDLCDAELSVAAAFADQGRPEGALG